MGLFTKKTISYIICGLGNPGKQYEETRHNVGFETIDRICKKYNIKVNKLSYESLYGIGKIDDVQVLLMKPQSYMNNSGVPLQYFVKKYDMKPENIIVICDDISLPTGKLRIRKNGSAGGHNGLKSIEAFLDSQNYPRLKIGVGDRADKREDLKDWVLGKFTQEDRKLINECEDDACEACSLIIKGRTDEAMNKYNGKQA